MRQFKTLVFVKVAVFLFLLALVGKVVAFFFLFGGFLSWICGFIGMYISTDANHKVAFLAEKGFKGAFDASFEVGKLVGFMTIGVGLFSIYFAYTLSIFFGSLDFFVKSMIGISFGASLISTFSRLGGGIFTKGADVGADLVGKIEANIPEDDPRNPAVIADNVGDNVGDCNGMVADMFESYVVSIASAVILASCVFDDVYIRIFALVPILVSAAGAWAGILILQGGWKIKESSRAASSEIALRTAYVSSFVMIGILGFSFYGVPEMFQVIICSLIGIFIAAIIMPMTEYYTSAKFRPVKEIAKASETGHATNIIQGLAVGLESCFAPLILILIAVAATTAVGGIFGLAISCVSMLSVASVVLALDAFGPVTDNAGGLVEMGGLSQEARDTTDKLDSLGNMTKATTKGYAVFSAGLASLVLCSTYRLDLKNLFPNVDWSMDIASRSVVMGLFLGAAISCLFAALAMRSVSKASSAIVEEVRRQFREMPGILEGKTKPLYSRAIDILTKASIREMIFPGLLPVLGTFLFFLIMRAFFGKVEAFLGLGGAIMGSTLVGVSIAFSMTTGGGAWDNSKKYIEAGAHGGKGSNAHKAAITGDTVGDPYKDTAGPAINPMIKLIAISAFLCIIAGS